MLAAWRVPFFSSKWFLASYLKLKTLESLISYKFTFEQGKTFFYTFCFYIFLLNLMSDLLSPLLVVIILTRTYALCVKLGMLSLIVIVQVCSLHYLLIFCHCMIFFFYIIYNNSGKVCCYLTLLKLFYVLIFCHCMIYRYAVTFLCIKKLSLLLFCLICWCYK